MNNEMDKLDDFFRKGLEDPVDKTSFRETDWDSLQQMLDGQKKRRRIVYWLPILSAAAAVLLIFVGLWVFVPKEGKQPKGQQVATRHQPTTPGKIKNPERQPEHKQAPLNLTEYVKNQPNQQNQVNQPNRHGNNRNDGNKSSKTPFAVPTLYVYPDDNHSGQNGIQNRQYAETLVAVSDQPIIEQSGNAYQVNGIDIPRAANGQVKGADMPKNGRNKLKIKRAFRQQLALTVLAAPDLSGVGSFGQGKLGTNFGLLFTGGLSKKFTVTTGVVYSDKPYLTGFENYHTPYTFPTIPDNVAADCRMLDIPVNINYQVYHKNQNKISFGTGLSSYVMMNQSYEFNYADPYAWGPKKFNVTGNDKYLFEILNFTATYQHQLNSKVGLSIQPYYKLPLANIGYSQVRLQTAGVAFGLSWNLSSISKN